MDRNIPRAYAAVINLNAECFLFLHLLVVFLLLLRLERRLCDSVQIPLPALCDPSASLVLILLQNANLLQRLHDLSVYRARSIDVV